MSECFRHNPLHAVPVVDLFLHGVIDKLLCLLVVKNHVLTMPVVLLGSLLVRNIVAEPFQKVVSEPTTAVGAGDVHRIDDLTTMRAANIFAFHDYNIKTHSITPPRQFPKDQLDHECAEDLILFLARFYPSDKEQYYAAWAGY